LKPVFERGRALEDGQVSFQWKDYREPDEQKFLRRFLLHSLPKGFQRIRYFGFLANRFRQEKLTLCRQLIQGIRGDLLPPATACKELLKSLAQPFLPLCPKCQPGHLRRILILPAYRWPTVAPPDSS
jgi:hypothetical protein